MQGNDLTRRDLIKSAGAAAVVAAPFIQTVKAANDQVQYGMIGTGSRGSYLLKHLKEIDTGRCVALCDIQPKQLDHGVETIGNNPAKYTDYREMLNRKDLDAVFVVTPLFTHFGITRDVLQSGRHVFCEKCLVFKPDRSARAPRVGGGASQADSADRVAAALQRLLSNGEADGG